MNKPSLPALPPEDLPSPQRTQLDVLLVKQLEEVISQRFYQSCGSIMRVLLSSCHWYFVTNAGTLTLLIICYEMESYWHIANVTSDIAKKLKLFANSATIRLCPPLEKAVPWEIGVNEILDEGNES